MNIKTEKEVLLDKIEKLEFHAKNLSVEIGLLRKQLGKINFEENEYKRWRAEVEEEFYYTLQEDGIVRACGETNSASDIHLYSIGNYFKTEEEAEEYKENLITKQKLKDLALRLNNAFKFDWKSTNQDKYFIGFSHKTKSLVQVSNCTWQYLNTIYCVDENFLDIAKEEIGEEALIKLIKSGV